MPRDLFDGRTGARFRSGAAGRRILYCWLPCFATDRIARRRPALAVRPVAIVRHDRGRRIAVAVNGPAGRSGVRPGQSLADARSLCPALKAVEADPAADSRLLLHLARWCTRYTPWVAPEAPAEDDPPAPAQSETALLLDISGCAHLAGGEEMLSGNLANRLEDFGFTVRCAVADTPGAARAWARHGDPLHPVIPEGAQADWLKPLPAAALRLRDADAETLTRLGIATVGDLMALPRAAVANRFPAGRAAGVLERLDRVLGIAPESIAPLPPPADYSVRQHYAEPVGTPEGMTAAFERLLLALARRLEAAGLGARQLEFAIVRADDTLDSARIGVSRPSRDPAHLARLFAPRLESLDPDPGIETVVLRAVSVEPFIVEQKAIQKVSRRSPVGTLHEKRRGLPIPQDRADLSQVDTLIDRLANRLGRAAVLRALPCETALPETQTRYAPALDLRAGNPASGWTAWQSPDRLAGPALPVRLLEAPEPVEAAAEAVPGRFAWRRRVWRVIADEGPARRLGRWWHGETAIRDYWQVAAVPAEASGGIPDDIPDGAAPVRLWLYRDPAAGPANRWSVHGLMG
ncbi:MAG: hypothetical protein OXM58_16215 [Rhodospirillaceae bacterium]|nr:hypothetical protein [Rhodospirillaceae bacterium]MDE0619818.1 hypothetical protein [Rhodospirillaceae bacterium]